MSKPSPQGAQSEETFEELAATLAAVNQKLEYRELYLEAFERLVISKVLKQQITLFNLGSQRKVGLRSAREGAMLNLEIKILRRNLFFLRARSVDLREKMEKLRPTNSGEPLPASITQPASEISGDESEQELVQKAG